MHERDVAIVTSENERVDTIPAPWLLHEIKDRKEQLEQEHGQKLYAVSSWGLVA